MATCVLVHGAWHGGWCWAETEDHLRALGHNTHAVTLTGLGERSHIHTSNIDADFHVRDVLNVIEWRELSDIILIGHSYGGMVITGVASLVPDNIGALIYVDAMVPEQSGISLFANANPERMAKFQAQIDAGATTLEPDFFDAWTDDPDKKAWLRKKCTPHPVACFERGVTLTGREREVKRKHYIIAARNKPSAFWSEYEKVGGRHDWTTSSIDTLHDVMVEAPEKLAHEIDRVVNDVTR